MMEFGKSLRAAREAKGYTVLQLADMTHMAPSVVENLEKEDFSHIAAPIYGRGFVKLYCEAVGLAPKPLIDQFMDILNGNNEPRIRERAVVPEEQPIAETPEPPVCEPEPEPIPAPPPQQDLFRSQTPLAEKKDFAPAAAYAPPPAATENEPTVSKYASPYRLTQSASSQRILRTGILALIALAIIALLLFGLRALHRATSNVSSPDTQSTSVPAETIPAENKAPAENKTPPAPRTVQSIPSLYID